MSSHLAARHVDAERIKKSEWLFIEGYVFANPATGQTAIREAIRIAKKHGTKVAITCSEAFIPQVFGEPLREALAQADLLFANESEACSLTGGEDAAEAFAQAQGRGAVVRGDGRPARRIRPPRRRRRRTCRRSRASRRT